MRLHIHLSLFWSGEKKKNIDNKIYPLGSQLTTEDACKIGKFQEIFSKLSTKVQRQRKTKGIKHVKGELL